MSGHLAAIVTILIWGINFISTKYLGAVRTSVYIYMVPVITIAASALILHEPVTPYLLFGTALTLAGLFLSELK